MYVWSSLQVKTYLIFFLLNKFSKLQQDNFLTWWKNIYISTFQMAQGENKQAKKK